MNLLPLATVAVIAGFMCQCKNSQVAEDNASGMVEVRSVAGYALLEELEVEDSYIGSELSEEDIERELASKSADLKKLVDKNNDGILSDEELRQLKSHFKDKMLEKFDIDSDGTFSHPELVAILDQIQLRLDDFRQRHAGRFSDKQSIICKMVNKRGAQRLLWQNIVDKCQG